jgi:hypothetical protein
LRTDARDADNRCQNCHSPTPPHSGDRNRVIGDFRPNSRPVHACILGEQIGSEGPSAFP